MESTGILDYVLFPFVFELGCIGFALGACVVFWYVSIPSIALVNYFYYRFLKKRNKFSLKRQLLFDLVLLLCSPLFFGLGKIIHRLLGAE